VHLVARGAGRFYRDFILVTALSPRHSVWAFKTLSSQSVHRPQPLHETHSAMQHKHWNGHMNTLAAIAHGQHTMLALP
jgi:hypothetical protein